MIRTTLAFTVFGPFLGGWGWSVAIFFIQLFDDHRSVSLLSYPSQLFTSTIAMPIIIAPFSYLFGVIPAFLTGLTFSIMFSLIDKKWRVARGIYAAIGATIAFCYSATLAYLTPLKDLPALIIPPSMFAAAVLSYYLSPRPSFTPKSSSVWANTQPMRKH